MAERPAKRAPRPGGGPRLAVIDGFAGRRSAIPFAVLVLFVLAIGLFGLLMLNTAMDNNSVRTQQAQQQQAALTDREQQLSQQLAGLSAPSALASEAAALGLVPNPQPAFLNPTTGAVLGSPSPAPTPSPTPSPTLSPSCSPTPGQTPSGTPSGAGSATASGTASGAVAAHLAGPAAPSAAVSGTVSATASGTPSATASGITSGAASGTVSGRPAVPVPTATTPTGSPR